VDGVGVVEQIQKPRRGGDGDWRVRVGVARSKTFDLMSCIVPKGSITVDGVSLTVVESWSTPRSRSRAAGTVGGFSVVLIPTTLAKTTLRHLEPGDPVNLEVDIIGKTVVTWIQRHMTASRGRRRRV
jgi:riboflavin synthase alpha subunit